MASVRQNRTLVSEALQEAFDQASQLKSGRTASYIPELAGVDESLFGICICDTQGQLDSVGDAHALVTLQSISKVLSYACALENYAEDFVQERVGVEASGEEFDSIIKLDRDKRPFNPMVNAGAIAITDLLLSKFKSQALERTLSFFALVLGVEKVRVNEAVFSSEYLTGERNRAIAHLLKNFGLLENSVDDVLQLYFRHCSVEVTTEELSKLGAVLANKGKDLRTGRDVLSARSLQRILSVMLSCGMYNYAGQWIYEVGLPAKSGVSGAVLTVVPGRLGIGVYSPRVDDKGCSLRAAAATKLLSKKLGLHIFELL